MRKKVNKVKKVKNSETRQKRYYERRKELGFKRFNLWLLPAELPIVNNFLKKLRSE